MLNFFNAKHIHSNVKLKHSIEQEKEQWKQTAVNDELHISKLHRDLI